VATSAAGQNEDLWSRSICANAFFNGVYAARVNRVGDEGGRAFCGGSFCAAPTGDFLGEPMGDVEGVGLFKIERKAVELTRREFPFLKDRRTRSYFDLAGAVLRREDTGNPQKNG
jgi:N-carbamoylputrescine amidase